MEFHTEGRKLSIYNPLSNYKKQTLKDDGFPSSVSRDLPFCRGPPFWSCLFEFRVCKWWYFTQFQLSNQLRSSAMVFFSSQKKQVRLLKGSPRGYVMCVFMYYTADIFQICIYIYTYIRTCTYIGSKGWLKTSNPEMDWSVGPSTHQPKFIKQPNLQLSHVRPQVSSFWWFRDQGLGGVYMWARQPQKKKNSLTFHYTGCLTGILIVVYEITPT